MKLGFKLLCSSFALFSLASANAASPIDLDKPIFSIPKTSAKIKIDGVIDEQVWQQAKVVQINNVTWPDENVESPVKTTAYVIEDGKTLYVAFKALDPNPSLIRANLTDRDKNWGDDTVGIKLDTYNDHALAYQFFINPLGTQSDSIENELTKQESPAWDGIWDSAGKINDDGYTVEVAIPLRILNFDDQLDVQKWGMELLRFYPRDKRLRISNAYMSQDNNCWICQMPTVTGFKGAKQGNNLTLVPTFVSGYSETRDLDEEPREPWQGDSNTDVGLDIKWGISPDVTLNATINPDFSQVEADSGQLNVNNTFALFTPEKRSFFLANQDYFSTPVNLIYTRNINDPDYGAKVAGKIGQHSFAAFAANDKTASFVLPGNLGSSRLEVEEETVNSALRYRYAVNNKLAFGTSATIRETDSYHNYVTSFDSKYQPDENNTFNVQLMTSDTNFSQNLIDTYLADEDTDEQTERMKMVNGNDHALRVSYNHSNRDWFLRYNHFNVGENFRADLAFFNHTDHIKNVLGGGYIWRGDKNDWWSRMEVSGDTDMTTNQNGEVIERENEIHFNVNGPMQSFARLSFVERTRVGKRIDNTSLAIEGNTDEFDEYMYRSWVEVKPASNVWLGQALRAGKKLDFANNRLSDVVVWEPKFNWNLNSHMQTRLSYTRSYMSYQDNEVYTANLIDFRVNYQFSIRSFLRFSLVNYDIHRNLDNYLADVRGDYNEEYKSLSSQLLFSYKVNPQTLFFIGYSDGGYQDDDLSKLTKNNRSVFMKLSYAWLR